MKTFEFKVTIEMQWNDKKSNALQKLHDWIEHYGHTSSSFGFEFKEVTNVKDSDQ